MNRIFKFLTFFLAVLLFQAYAQDTPKYVGADKCKICHKKAEDGDQYKIWSESKHANAMKALATEEAKKIAKAKGIADPAKDAKCTKCHSTFAAVDAKMLDSKTKLTLDEGVSCEGCHGPGSEYKSKKVMQDKKAAMAAGLVIPDEKTCKGCHNSESPTFKDFNFAEASKKIAHKIPKK
jgi:Cytochrome c554 and c-prime